MERDLNLTRSDMALILGISNHHVDELVRARYVTPAVSMNNVRFWKPEDIFRGFVALVLVQEYINKYGSGKYKQLKYPQVRTNLTVAMRKPERFLKTSEWKAVVERACSRGINFAGSNFDYIEAPEG